MTDPFRQTLCEVGVGGGARSTDGDCTAFPAWLVERTKRALHAKHGIYGYLWWISMAELVKRSPIFRIYGYYIYIYI